jgi:hypothetical protein
MEHLDTATLEDFKFIKIITMFYGVAEKTIFLKGWIEKYGL